MNVDYCKFYPMAAPVPSVLQCAQFLKWINTNLGNWYIAFDMSNEFSLRAEFSLKGSCSHLAQEALHIYSSSSSDSIIITESPVLHIFAAENSCTGFYFPH